MRRRREEERTKRDEQKKRQRRWQAAEERHGISGPVIFGDPAISQFLPLNLVVKYLKSTAFCSLLDTLIASL